MPLLNIKISLAYELFKRVRAHLTIKRIFRTRLITIFGYFREGVCAWRRCAKAHEVCANAFAHQPNLSLACADVTVEPTLGKHQSNLFIK